MPFRRRLISGWELHAPTIQSLTQVVTTALHLTWTDNNTDETSYRIERSTDGVIFTEVGSTAANVTSFDDSTITPGTLYYYRIRARNSNGNSPYSLILFLTSVSDSDALAWLNNALVNATTPFYNPVRSAVDTYVSALKSNGVWNNVDRLYINIVSATACTLCLKTLTTRTMVASPQWGALVGPAMRFDGVSQYSDLNVAPSALTNMTTLLAYGYKYLGQAAYGGAALGVADAAATTFLELALGNPPP